MVFACVFKVYVGFSSRRFTSDLRDAYTGGLIDSRPHFNSVSNYLSSPELTDVLKKLITASSLPLKAIETDFAVDTTCFSTYRYVRWFNKKYGREIDNRERVKVHLMCGVNTNVVTAVDISGWAASGACPRSVSRVTGTSSVSTRQRDRGQCPTLNCY